MKAPKTIGEDFGLLVGDPFTDPNATKPKRKPRARKDRLQTMKPIIIKMSNRGKSLKVLTKSKRSGIMKSVNKLNRKDDKMANDKNKKIDRQTALISVAWLVEASFRIFTGWILLAKFNGFVTTAVALYALGTAGAIVVSHFVRAHK